MKKRHIVHSPRRSPSSIAISVVVHGAVAALLATMTMGTIPLEALFGPRPPKDDSRREQVTYVRTQTQPAGVPRVAPAPRRQPEAPALGAPASIVAPTNIPTTIPPVSTGAAPIGVAGGVAGGTSLDAIRREAVRGVEPAIPDARLDLDAVPWGYTPKNAQSRADSAIAAIYGLYRDSIIAQQMNPRRAAGDWTTTRNGQKWGWDQGGIRLGPISIPNAVLALIPVPLQGRNVNAITDGRMQAWTQQDLQRAAQGMSQDEFKAAVKRIRERTDRERRDKAAKKP